VCGEGLLNGCGILKADLNTYLQHIHCACSRGRALCRNFRPPSLFADKLWLSQVQYIGTDTQSADRFGLYACHVTSSS